MLLESQKNCLVIVAESAAEFDILRRINAHTKGVSLNGATRCLNVPTTDEDYVAGVTHDGGINDNATSDLMAEASCGRTVQVPMTISIR